MTRAHLLSYGCEDGAVLDHFHTLDASLRDMLLEAVLHRLFGGIRLGSLDREAQAVLARRLRDHDDVHLGVAHGVEEHCGGTRHADKPGALDVDDRHVVNRCETLHLSTVGGVGESLLVIAATHGIARAQEILGIRDDGARCVEVEEVSQHDRNVVLHRRERRRRVQHVCSKVAQLPSLVVRQSGQADSLAHLSRIRTVHAVNIRPDGDHAALE
mmetsp:Transcript_12594/g.33508  ORF Transcript_12594/g.33508 Transcript_12594/m.33508 type:complete len:214 (-) Transcript_12594:1025-1666(-)